MNVYKISNGNFLKQLYNIETLDDGIIWLKNNQTLPLFTQYKILDLLLLEYGNENKYFFMDDLVISIIKKIIDNFWKNEFNKSFDEETIKNTLIKYSKKKFNKNIFSHIINIKQLFYLI